MCDIISRRLTDTKTISMDKREVLFMSKDGYNPLAIANHLIDLSATQEYPGIYLTKLIKLVYINHGVSLAQIEKPLSNEPVEAGDFGPYFTSIYTMFKDYALTEDLKIRKVTERATGMGIKFRADFEPDANKIMKEVFEKFKNVGGWVLSKLTHNKNSPWSKTQKYAMIKNENIQAFYQSLLNGRSISQIEISQITAL